jgi:outer membrane protein TolC
LWAKRASRIDSAKARPTFVPGGWPFGDPLLTRYVAVALEQNLDIAQAGARVAQARASLRLSTSALLPSVNGTRKREGLSVD